MADLPDLDTTGVGYIAYYNVLDNTSASSIDPSEIVSEPNVNSFDAYDNGVLITSYSLSNNRQCKVRCKTDGWIAVYLDRTKKFNRQTSNLNDIRGYTDLIPFGTSNSRSATSIAGGTTLENAIDSLVDEFSNSGIINNDFTINDIGLYNYEYPNATATSQQGKQNSSGTGSTISDSFSYKVEANTNVLWGSAFMGGEMEDSIGSSSGNIEGFTLISISSSGSSQPQYGKADLVARGFDTGGNSYTISISGGRDAEWEYYSLTMWN